ncbi:hypothetical protein MA16_Dca025892 [Dendrobium catenatum]|uniref:Uncharacterized protein n=1 Tax=Dendrobium catenatum TaxID=906689 RepID=A0A2I0W2G1_9ASPA|nr:hypothetical protein MA16_Dca025892 [Dendrobium catenatum]
MWMTSLLPAMTPASSLRFSNTFTQNFKYEIWVHFPASSELISPAPLLASISLSNPISKIFF